MKHFFIFLAIPLSFALYLVLALNLMVYQRYPVVHYLIALVALIFLGKALKDKFSFYRLGLNLAGWVLLLFFGWWTLFFSSYESQAPAFTENPNLQLQMVDLSLKNAEGQTVTLGDSLATHQATLLVFYRGYW